MESTVNDFFNEINELMPTVKATSTPTAELKDCVPNNKLVATWQKCYDDASGYYYYWNTSSNEVTWEKPFDCKSNNTLPAETSTKPFRKSAASLYLPPKSSPLLSTINQLPDVAQSVKIYKIGEVASSQKQLTENVAGTSKTIHVYSSSSDGNDRKTDSKLVSTYDSDSSNEETSLVSQLPQNANDSHCVLVSVKPLEAKDDLLKASQDSKAISKECLIEINENKLSLVAGYNETDSESEDETSFVQSISTAGDQTVQTGNSTLFPIVQSVSVSDFETSKPISGKSPPDCQTDDFDSKAFQRKRRIGVSLVNDTSKRRKNEVPSKDDGQTVTEKSMSNSLYTNFTRGGVLFEQLEVKDEGKKTNLGNVECKLSDSVSESFTLLKEKMSFLSEGKEAVSPVQVALIQMEILMGAFNTGNLKLSYLESWLAENLADLIKLEKDTAPYGWLLQWDRSQKQYYYQNEATGQTQWEYPKEEDRHTEDINRCDEAMDISTTPPPMSVNDKMLPHKSSKQTLITSASRASPLRDRSKSPEKITTDCEYSEPYPPGVDISEIQETQQSVATHNKCELNDALSSFYSDIAALENIEPAVASVEYSQDSKSGDDSVVIDVYRKRKKTKMKLTQGIAMKKKEVTKLVEKWKHVQRDYD